MHPLTLDDKTKDGTTKKTSFVVWNTDGACGRVLPTSDVVAKTISLGIPVYLLQRNGPRAHGASWLIAFSIPAGTLAESGGLVAELACTIAAATPTPSEAGAHGVLRALPTVSP